uniref:RING-type domain-containing protein n=1 Tax=Oryza meridionalis TaxID=40149 RepID=A0A0E0C532_9ORYZ
MAAVETRISITDFSCKMVPEHKATSESTSTTTACSSVHIRCEVTVKYASRRLRGNGKPVRDRQPDKPWTTEETRHTVAPGSDEACGICREKFGMGGGASSDPVNLPCEHAFHANCSRGSTRGTRARCAATTCAASWSPRHGQSSRRKEVAA